jgi:pimeloyl-ACP methyl ester carboxylesterase
VTLLPAALVACTAQATQAPATSTGFIENGDVRLSYQLDTPAGRPPFPAVVIGHGSGETRKDACRPLAVQMLQRGYATLCYDKRGVGASTGTYINMASDMAAAVAFLRGRDDINPRRVGLMGPSQAGWIIPIAAASVKPAFMILIVGPAVSVGEEMHFSRLAEGTATPLETLRGSLASFAGPHGFDPRPVLATLAVPGLWILGGADRSIRRPFARVVFPDADHSLRGVPIFTEIDRWLATLPRERQ